MHKNGNGKWEWATTMNPEARHRRKDDSHWQHDNPYKAVEPATPEDNGTLPRKGRETVSDGQRTSANPEDTTLAADPDHEQAWSTAPHMQGKDTRQNGLTEEWRRKRGGWQAAFSLLPTTH